MLTFLVAAVAVLLLLLLVAYRSKSASTAAATTPSASQFTDGGEAPQQQSESRRQDARRRVLMTLDEPSLVPESELNDAFHVAVATTKRPQVRERMIGNMDNDPMLQPSLPGRLKDAEWAPPDYSGGLTFGAYTTEKIIAAPLHRDRRYGRF